MMQHNKISFKNDSDCDFYQVLKSRVLPAMKQVAPHINRLTWIKVFLFPILYLATYTVFVLFGTSLPHLFGAYIIFGILMPLTVVNIVHDAVHGCLFKSHKANFLARHAFDIIGGNSFVWQKRHVSFHHPNPNILNWDIDLERRKIYTLSPADEHKAFHRYQHLYMPFVFPLFTLHWVLFRDFKDYYDKDSMFRKKIDVPLVEFIKLPIFKAIYFFHIILLPIMLTPFQWHQVLLAFLVLHVMAAIGALIILLPNHWDEDAEFHEVPSGVIQESWAVYQLRHTNDFAIYNPIANFLMGGLNHHVAHHLFPATNHNYLPSITKEVIKLARERGLPYKCFSLFDAIATHFRLLKKNGLTYGTQTFDKNL